jgi:hypothetical protein
MLTKAMEMVNTGEGWVAPEILQRLGNVGTFVVWWAEIGSGSREPCHTTKRTMSSLKAG